MSEVNFSVITDDIHAEPQMACDVAQASGVRNLVLRGVCGERIPFISQERWERLKHTITSYQLTVTAVMPYLFNCTVHDDDFKEQPEILKQSLDFAEDIGVKKLILPCVRRHPDDARGDYRTIIDQFKECINIASGRGFTLCVINERGRFVDTGENILRILKILGEDGLKLCWDPAQAYDAGDSSFEEVLKAVAPYLDTIYIKDVAKDHHWVPVGQGRVPLTEILRDTFAGGNTPELLIGTHAAPRDEAFLANLNYVRNLTSILK